MPGGHLCPVSKMLGKVPCSLLKFLSRMVLMEEIMYLNTVFQPSGAMNFQNFRGNATLLESLLKKSQLTRPNHWTNDADRPTKHSRFFLSRL